MKKAHFLLWLALAIMMNVLDTTGVYAQRVDGAVSLNLTVPVLRYAFSDVESEALNEPVEADDLNIGLSIPGIGLGYGMSKNIIIGIGVGPSYSSSEIEEQGKTEIFALLFGPYFEYILSSQSDFQPYIQFGLGLALQTQRLSGDFMVADGFKRTQTEFVINAAIGGHGFATETFSIDPFLSFAYLAGAGEIEFIDLSEDFQTNGFAVALGMALSGWI